MKKYFRTLTIAGSDSSGGAGIQADLKTFSALGCFGMSAITALTAQNTREITGIFPVPPEFIGQQIDAVMDDIGVDAIKIGMLHSPEVIEMVARKMTDWKCPNIVVDPVMISKSGNKLLQDDAVRALKEHLFPLATLITPNLPEASVLLGRPVENQDDMARAAKDLAGFGSNNVLVKGGHLMGDDSRDLLYQEENKTITKFSGKKIKTSNSHGTGCTLSSAIAANLAKGVELKTAVKNAKDYIIGTLKAAGDYQTGKGNGPVHHFYKFWL
ncbi:MAG: bifunctional hydroxymethylpyrimidine kinase/phosphomethylpyrimidine kinase [Desulfobacteraceae bacterium]|nr:bifunctional hydroxymethylpyrimidine kinase/phosphomethylpyrimidine kinase [Desulfobacteraceae bacterium]